MIDRYNLLKIFRKHFESRIQINNDEWKSIVGKTRIIKVQRGSCIREISELAQGYAFVLKGGLRSYFFDDRQKESTMLFEFENSWLNGFQKIYTPSVVIIEAIEVSWLAVIKEDDFERLRGELRGFSDYTDTIRLEVYGKSLQRMHCASFLDATQRYRFMLTHNPEIILRAPQYMIASYLRMNAETLSRIRKKIVEKVRVAA